MRRFIIRRLLQSLLLIFAVMSLSWLLINLAPGGPDAVFASNPRLTLAQREAIRVSYGLDKPLWEQYITWMGRVFTLDFGRSYFNPLPAMQVIGQRIWPTVQLGFFSYIFGLLGVPLGVYAARHRGKFADSFIRVITVLGSTMPVWWFSLLFIIILASTVKWIPQGQGTNGPIDWALHLFIPAFLLSIGTLVGFTRFVRSETLETLSQDYVRTAKAKGLAEQQINRWHVLRNSLIPVVTLLGYFLPSLVGGAIITEQIFNWPGMGRLFYEAATERDMPVLLGILFLTSVLTILGNLMADVGYGLVDPRVRYE